MIWSLNLWYFVVLTCIDIFLFNYNWIKMLERFQICEKMLFYWINNAKNVLLCFAKKNYIFLTSPNAIWIFMISSYKVNLLGICVKTLDKICIWRQENCKNIFCLSIFHKNLTWIQLLWLVNYHILHFHDFVIHWKLDIPSD